MSTLEQENASLKDSLCEVNSKCDELSNINTTLQDQINVLNKQIEDRDKVVMAMTLEMSKFEYQAKIALSENQSMQHIVQSTNNPCDRVTRLLEQQTEFLTKSRSSPETTQYVSNNSTSGNITQNTSNPFIQPPSDTSNLNQDTQNRDTRQKTLVYVLGTSQCTGIQPERLFRDKEVIGITDPPYTIVSAAEINTTEKIIPIANHSAYHGQ